MKKQVGRPTVMTKAVVDKLETAFSYGASDIEACFFANISKQTLYDYQKIFPEFVDRKAGLKEQPILKARRAVVDALEENPELALKFLERKKKDEFSLKQEVEHSGEMTQKTVLIDAGKNPYASSK